MNAVVIALFSLVSLIVTVLVAPLVISYQLGKMKSSEREQEWARQDELALRAERSAREIIASNVAVAEAALTTAEHQNKKLDVIHILTNSTLSAAKEAQLVALEQSLGLLLREQPRDETEIAVTQGKVDALRLEVAERARQDALAAQVAAAPDPPA